MSDTLIILEQPKNVNLPTTGITVDLPEQYFYDPFLTDGQILQMLAEDTNLGKNKSSELQNELTPIVETISSNTKNETITLAQKDIINTQNDTKIKYEKLLKKYNNNQEDKSFLEEVNLLLVAQRDRLAFLKQYSIAAVEGKIQGFSRKIQGTINERANNLINDIDNKLHISLGVARYNEFVNEINTVINTTNALFDDIKGYVNAVLNFSLSEAIDKIGKSFEKAIASTSEFIATLTSPLNILKKLKLPINFNKFKPTKNNYFTREKFLSSTSKFIQVKIPDAFGNVLDNIKAVAKTPFSDTITPNLSVSTVNVKLLGALKQLNPIKSELTFLSDGKEIAGSITDKLKGL